jgi:hypothetical protein
MCETTKKFTAEIILRKKNTNTRCRIEDKRNQTCGSVEDCVFKTSQIFAY